MATFKKISPDCWLFTFNNKGRLLTYKQANQIAIDLFANGLIELEVLKQLKP